MSSESAGPKVSVILPVYNEEACIQAVLDELLVTLGSRLQEPFEVIAVDDGSSDATPQILQRLAQADRRLRVLRLTPNAGQSAAFCAGFRAAAGEIIVTMDADGQNDPADIPSIVRRLDACDCCCGYRAQRQDSASRRWASRLANAVRNRALGEDIIDTGCSMKAFKASYVRNLQPWDGLHRFFATFVSMQGGTIIQQPVHHRARSAGISKYTNWKRLQKTMRDLRGVIWLKSRTRLHRVERLA